MTDIVIPLGTGSPWENNELRYALRSMQKHLQGYRNVYIVGEKPKWLTNVIHLPFDEISLAVHREKNICMKVVEACMHAGLSDELIFMNDDHFFLQDMEAAELPYYFDGTVTDRKLGVNDYNVYMKTIKNTEKLLGGNALNFDVHTPVRFNQSLYLHIMNRVDWNRPYGYLMKSIYCNQAGVAGAPLPDLKINMRLTGDEIFEAIMHRPFFSIGNAGLNDCMKGVLQILYPKPSAYEL